MGCELPTTCQQHPAAAYVGPAHLPIQMHASCWDSYWGSLLLSRGDGVPADTLGPRKEAPGTVSCGVGAATTIPTEGHSPAETVRVAVYIRLLVCPMLQAQGVIFTSPFLAQVISAAVVASMLRSRAPYLWWRG